MRAARILLLSSIATWMLSASASAGVVSMEYRYHAVVDADVLPNTMTEVWGKLYRPEQLGSNRHPLIVMLHGNHSTCGSTSSPIVGLSCAYTYTGSCPAGQAVIPNHLGYEYLANDLASRGYIVVSINANRGITCGSPVDGDAGLNLARGRLILRHLALLSQWNRFGNAPSALGDLQGKIDFSQVGLFGHSRGGEGVRAAYQLYREAGSPWKAKIRDAVNFRAIYEIGPVDGQTSRVLNADGTAWNVLLPTCDGDVVNLQGMKVFDRMSQIEDESPALPKSMLAVWGANHNYYNTQWQTSDADGCVGATPLWSGDVGSAQQRQTAIDSVVPFFQANLGTQTDKSLENRFDPLMTRGDHSLPRLDLAFLLSSNTHVVTSMSRATQTSTTVFANEEAVPDHDGSLPAIKVTWMPDATAPYFENIWKPAGDGYSLSEAKTFDFRITRTAEPINTDSTTDFHLQLLYSDGTLGPSVKLSDYALLTAPPESKPDTYYSWPHLILQTVRIPVSALAPNSSAKVRGVRFKFDVTTAGQIYLSNVAFSKFMTSADAAGFTPPSGLGDGIHLFRMAHGNSGSSSMPASPTALSARVRPVRKNDRISKVSRSSRDSDVIEVEVEAQQSFPVQDALPVLLVNGRDVAAGGFPETGEQRTLIFRMSRSELGTLPAKVKVGIGHRGSPIVWSDLGEVSRSTFGL